MLNPLFPLYPLTLLLISIPLAFFASITTTLALVTLLIRVGLVYFELFLALIRSYLSTTLIPTNPTSTSTTTNTTTTTPHPARSRRSSSSAASDRDRDRTPTLSAHPSSTALPRDYESIGGWHLTPSSPQDEALWMRMNSRLELPLVGTTPSPAATKRNHRHRRSWTSGSQAMRHSWSPEIARRSPARTPKARSVLDGGDGGYFELYGPAAAAGPGHERKRSNGGSGGSLSSGSSGASGRIGAVFV